MEGEEMDSQLKENKRIPRCGVVVHCFWKIMLCFDIRKKNSYTIYTFS
jgi:hypothetical protein